MNAETIAATFPRGLLRPELFLGVASSISARSVGVNLSEAGNTSGSHFAGGRYGRGEVGEFVLIEGQQSLLLGRIAEIRVGEAERRGITPEFTGNSNLPAIGLIQLLGCVGMCDLKVVAGVDAYPRLGDRIYAAPHAFLALLPQLMDLDESDTSPVEITLGHTGQDRSYPVSVKPERLFGRHCAILGATGGGKSWTTARIIGQSLEHGAKLILLDATGEYREFRGAHTTHLHLGDPVDRADGSTPCLLPPTGFVESDFIALFEPSGKVQGPKLRAAIRSLRLAAIQPDLATDGIIHKFNQSREDVDAAEADSVIAARLDDPREPFDTKLLTRQIHQECVWPNGGTQRAPDYTVWGNPDEASYSYCLSMIVRINAVISSTAYSCVFGDNPDASNLTEAIETFIADANQKLMRICLSGVSFEYHAREIMANVIGRQLLGGAREGRFRNQPTLLLVDEAHNFLGRRIGSDDYAARLDAFELISKEGRKYGLNLCLASQRPRDITEDVLSQMGTLIVHRLTNDRDREVVERACGEIDRSASAFLPNLRPGEAAIIGTDFPIPLTLQVARPTTEPKSAGPDYQKNWHRPA